MPRRHGSHYTYRGCRLTRTPAGWEITKPDGTPSPTQTVTIRQAYRIVDELPGIPPKADPKTAGSLGGKAFYAKYRLEPYGTSDFAIVDRQTGVARRTMNGYYIPARRSA